MTTARGHRKLEGLLKHHLFGPSIIFSSMVLDQEQMSRIYSAITMQAYWRRYITRKRYLVGKRLLKQRKAEWLESIIPDWESGFCTLLRELHDSCRNVQSAGASRRWSSSSGKTSCAHATGTSLGSSPAGMAPCGTSAR